MDPLRYHEICEANHRILNPLTAAKLELLGEIVRLSPGDRMLDLACGKGEALCQWSHRYGISGTGVDTSSVFLSAAEERAAELGVADRVDFVGADASTYQADPASYDLVSCMGATWIGGGLVGTIELMRRAVKPTGLLLIGEVYWAEPMPDAALTALGMQRDDFASLVGTLDRFEGAGCELVEMVLADGDSWDRYCAAQWWTVNRWLNDNPDHEDVAEVREILQQSRRSHLEYGRRYLGWGVFVVRP